MPTPIFEFVPDFGITVQYKFNNQVHESFTGKTYVNALWEQPKTNITFNKGWLDQVEYDYLKQFFQDVKGSASVFLFADPIDNYASNTPTISFNAQTQGVVYEVGGNKYLGKRYQLGDQFIIRPISRPVEGTIELFNNTVPTTGTIDYDTGLVTGDATRWKGHFYIPCTFENDTLPVSIIGFDEKTKEQTYQVPDLRLVEVKERLFLESGNIDIVPNSIHYFELPLPIETEVNRISKTDIFDSDSGYSVRDEVGVIRTEINIPSFICDRTELNYLLCVQRTLLGEWGNIKFKDEESGFDNSFRSKNSFSYQVVFEDIDKEIEPTYRAMDMEFCEDDDGLKSSYCHAWRIKKIDGSFIGFTNHDRDVIDVGQVLYKANAGFKTTSANKTAEANTDSLEVTSVFVDALIDEDELLSGQFDNAELIVNLYDWKLKSIVSRISTGNLGGNSIGYLINKPKQYSIEGLSITDRLDSSRSLKTSSQCRHEFLSQGYGKCNRVIDSSVRENATVTAIVDSSTITVSIPTLNYNLGQLTFTSGIYAGRSLYIASSSGNNMTFSFPLSVLPNVGDSCHLTRGCDKTLDACASYNNAVNFGGQPFLPGVDKTIAKST